MEHLFHLTNCHGEWTVFMQGLTLLSDTFPLIQHYWRTHS